MTKTTNVRWTRARQEREPERYLDWLASQQRRQKDRMLRRRYNIDLAEYERLVAEQDGRCKMCGEEPTGRWPLHVDHDHTSGRVRGLLCGPCNWFLGMLENGILERAQRYLS